MKIILDKEEVEKALLAWAIESFDNYQFVRVVVEPLGWATIYQDLLQEEKKKNE